MKQALFNTPATEPVPNGAGQVTGVRATSPNGHGLRMMQKVGTQLHDIRTASASPMGAEIKGAPGPGEIDSTCMWKIGGASAMYELRLAEHHNVWRPCLHGRINPTGRLPARHCQGGKYVVCHLHAR